MCEASRFLKATRPHKFCLCLTTDEAVLPPRSTTNSLNLDYTESGQEIPGGSLPLSMYFLFLLLSGSASSAGILLICYKLGYNSSGTLFCYL